MNTLTRMNTNLHHRIVRAFLSTCLILGACWSGKVVASEAADCARLRGGGFF